MKTLPKIYPSFFITVLLEGKPYRLSVRLLAKGSHLHRYQVSAGNKLLEFEHNQPLLERNGIHNFPWHWTLVSGEIPNPSYQEVITNTLEAFLKGQGNDPGKRE